MEVVVAVAALFVLSRMMTNGGAAALGGTSVVTDPTPAANAPPLNPVFSAGGGDGITSPLTAILARLGITMGAPILLNATTGSAPLLDNSAPASPSGQSAPGQPGVPGTYTVDEMGDFGAVPIPLGMLGGSFDA